MKMDSPKEDPRVLDEDLYGYRYYNEHLQHIRERRVKRRQRREYDPVTRFLGTCMILCGVVLVALTVLGDVATPLWLVVFLIDVALIIAFLMLFGEK